MSFSHNGFAILHGPHWSLPIKVESVAGLMRVRPIGTLTAAMLKAVSARIAQLGTSNGQDWFLTPQTLERFADHAERGARADDCISWVSHTGRVKLTEQPAGMEGFFEEFVRAGFAASVPQAQLLHGAWCQLLLDRLILQCKPVDLGFATLEALPLRADWSRSLFLRRMVEVPRCTPAIIKKRLSGGRLMAYDQWNKIMLLRIEVRHRRAWWKGVIKTELAIREAKGPGRYMIGILERLRAKEQAMYEIFTEFIAQTRRAALEIPFRTGRRNKTTRRIIKPTVRQVQKLLRFGKSTGRLDARAGYKGVAATVGETIKNLPQMSGVQPRSPDLRDCAQESEEPPAGTEG